MVLLGPPRSAPERFRLANVRVNLNNSKQSASKSSGSGEEEKSPREPKDEATRNPPPTYKPAAASSSNPAAEPHSPYCICTECDCGRHHCPPTPMQNSYQKNLETEHSRRYRGGGECPRRAGPPSSRDFASEPFEGLSLYRQDFTKHPNAQTRPFRPDENNRPQTARLSFNGNTTHRSDYTRFPGDNRGKSFKPHERPDSSQENRDFLTEQQREYTRKQGDRAKIRHSPDYQRNNGEFQGNSTHRRDYRPFSSKVPQTHRANHFRYTLPENRDFLSDYRYFYTDKGISPLCPMIPLAVTTKSHSGHIWLEKIPPNQYKRIQQQSF